MAIDINDRTEVVADLRQPVSTTFARFEPEASSEPWLDVEIRGLEPEDVSATAVLLAEREGLSSARAGRIVASWIGTGDRLVHIAERGGQVCGYGKAEWLDPGAQGGSGPAGWYLAGLVVAPSARRHGVGRLLTQSRLTSLASRTREVWYFANTRNAATIRLHEEFGFAQQDRDFAIPGVSFEGGDGVLFRRVLAQPK